METLRRRTRRMFAFGKGIVGPDAGPARLAVLPDAVDLAASTSALVLPAAAFTTPIGPGDGHEAGLPGVLRAAGMLAGVRADRGREPLAAGAGWVTSGLDGLADRLDGLHALGAQLALWITAEVDTGAPQALTANAQAAARFAYAAQRANLVPLIRVGSAPGAQAAYERADAQAAALVSVCLHLEDLDVDLAATVLALEPPPSPPAVSIIGAVTSTTAIVDPLAMLPRRLGGVALISTARSSRAAAASKASSGAQRVGAGRPWPVTFYLGWPTGTDTSLARTDQRGAHVQDRRRRARG
ncbi:MAG: fructose-bisphosphate aldolase, class [Pseudonocardiales bacterium]|jgi:fructose-bisphosphate aldolase class I|nr:fructose-bisphosphate aldolase, class [Pseudonocardiales bacterium]MDT7776619.1 fructose-bisphosphate aldolase, class [Pseudonocardiales bacterium]